jgi:hypothetical protein
LRQRIGQHGFAGLPVKNAMGQTRLMLMNAILMIFPAILMLVQTQPMRRYRAKYFGAG